ncbi:uncharacterized protein EAE98_008091 [Botrytis deweyae]|uniref:Uncharacterized protein n=1 Tax=Botrytis deweyae TaxID=2478750 RepID=A0ABQ7IFM1_9HELO|nr:uncharacterized protein EAE98_008091 [Botrytis deweyae]KAF7922565.1 hypothetical protein EAE98_008091 [Botrytis deweyae]
MTSSSSSSPNPNHNPNLSLHLTDLSLTPLISTSSSSRPSNSNSNSNSHAKPPQFQSLTTLTSTALSAYNASLHLNLGSPQRIIVESASSGPILLHSFISPTSSTPHSTSSTRHRSRSTHTNALDTRTNGSENLNGVSNIRSLEILSAAREEMRPLSGTTEGSHSEQERHDVRDEGAQAPLLVGTIVARTAEHVGEARKAAHRIEIIAHGFQRELMRDTKVKRMGEDESMAGEG